MQRLSAIGVQQIAGIVNVDDGRGESRMYCGDRDVSLYRLAKFTAHGHKRTKSK
jgi:hypothetical protein